MRDARLEHERRRWLRPDWERWLRPDWERYVRPDQAVAMRAEFAERKAAVGTWRCARERLRDEQIERDQQAALAAEQRREIECAALALKAELASLRFELVWAELRRKAGFNPDQPRDELGRWTDNGSETVSDDSNADSSDDGGELPPAGHNNPPERVPSERPEESRDRTTAIRAASRLLGRIAPAVARLSALGTLISGAAWLREYRDEILTNLDPPKTLQELHDAVDVPRSGTHRHHIVERGPAEDEGFSGSMINARDNLVRIPKQKHQEISDWYSTKNDYYEGLSPRDWLRGKGWEERRALGITKLIDLGVLKP